MEIFFLDVQSPWQHLLTPWRRVLREKLLGFQLVKKFPAFYGTRRFITAVISARDLYLSWASSIQSIPPHPTSWRSILILSSHPRLGKVRGFLRECFVTNTFLRWGVVNNSPNPEAGRPPLVGCPRLLIQYIRNYLPYWRLFLHPQPENAPYRGDRDPLITVHDILRDKSDWDVSATFYKVTTN